MFDFLMAVLIFAVVPFGILFILFKLMVAWGRSLKHEYDKGYQKASRGNYAIRAANGEKPIGKPWGAEFGNAYFLSPEQVKEAGLGVSPEDFWPEVASGGNLLTLGEYSLIQKGKKPNPVVVVSKESGHTLTIAPTRSGKGVSAAVPNLLFYGGSMVVNDIKGELHAVTARRRREMGQDVYAFAPFAPESASLNPLDLIDKEQPFEDIRQLAQLVIPESTGDSAFWDNLARNLLAGVVATVIQNDEPQKRTMAEVRHLLTLPRKDFEGLLEVISKGGERQAARAANNYLSADEKVRAGVLSTLDSHLQIWDSPRLEAVTEKTDFAPADLKLGKVTVYFILPPEQLDSFAPVIRLFMGMLVAGMTKEKTKPDIPVLFLLDEFPALGRVAPIESGIAYLAGYGVRLWFFAQDLKQLTTTYGEASANSLMSNCAVKQFFGVADNATAEYVSKYAGDMTAPTIGFNESSGTLIFSSKDGTNLAATGRPLLAANEVMTLPPDQQIIFAKGQPPIKCVKTNYLTMGDTLKDQYGQPVYDDNPFHT